MVVIPGHSEYWTENARRNFDKFIDHGGSGLVLSGNAMFRKVEYDDPENPTLLKFSPRRQFTNASLGYPTWESIGADFKHGGNGSKFPTSQAINTPYGGYKMLDVSKPYLAGTGLEVGDVMENPTVEWDGVPFTSLDPVTGPVIDTELLGFEEISLIGFDNASYGGMVETVGTWIDFKKTKESGRIINVGSMSWTADGVGRDLKRQVTRNMIDYLLIDQVDFDEDNGLTGADIDLLRNEMHAESPRIRFDLSEDGIVNEVDFNRLLGEYAQTTMGDANLDRRVDFRDFILLAKKFNHPSGWNGGDFDGNRVADFRDFLLLATNFSNEPLRTESIPEPSGFCLAMFAVAVLSHVKRSRR